MAYSPGMGQAEWTLWGGLDLARKISLPPLM